jgi:thiamine biosynthesis lipoprotein
VSIKGIIKDSLGACASFIVVLGLSSSILYAQNKDYVTVKKSMTLRGSRFDITVVPVGMKLEYMNIQEATGEIRRIAKLIFSWDSDSETSLINKNAGVKPVRVRLELFKLMERFKQILEVSSGDFHITFAGMDTIWRFDGSMTTIPTKSQVSKAKTNVGYEKILLDAANQSVFPSRKGMKISVGAIGKEYASYSEKEGLLFKKVVAGVLNTVSAMTAWGKK